MAQARTEASSSHTGIRIGLSAVIIALRGREAVVLTTHAPDGDPALPFGPFDPARDRTFELALRAFVADQTGFPLGFVEQLYTFGDLGRDAPRATPGPDQARDISVGYLALTAEGRSFSDFLWSFVDGKPIRNDWTSLAQVPAKTHRSDAMSKALTRAGFKFVGSTICYAFMQAAGMVNDHLVTCPRYGVVGEE